MTFDADKLGGVYNIAAGKNNIKFTAYVKDDLGLADDAIVGHLRVSLDDADELASEDWAIHQVYINGERHDGIVQGNASCLKNSITEIQVAQFEVYPNPTKDQVNITSTDIQRIESVKLFDVAGKLVLEKSTMPIGELQLNIERLAAGMYILLVNDEQRFKVVKQ